MNRVIKRFYCNYFSLPFMSASGRTAGIKDTDKQLHTTEIVGCNYFSLALIPASGTTIFIYAVHSTTSKWRHNGRDGVSNHQPHDFYSIVYSDTDQRKYQSSTSLAFVRGIHRSPVNSPHKWPVTRVTRKMFPFDDVITIMLTVTVCSVLLWFGTGRFCPYPSGLLDWHWGNHTITPVPVN